MVSRRWPPHRAYRSVINKQAGSFVDVTACFGIAYKLTMCLIIASSADFKQL